MFKVITAMAVGLCWIGSLQAAQTIALTDLDLSKVRQGWGEPKVNQTIVGKPLRIGGQAYERGLGSHARMVLHIQLDGQAQSFQAWVGVDDETGGKGTVRFRVLGDGRTLFDSGVMKGGDKAKRVDVDLRGIRMLLLLVDDAGDDIHFDHADWAEAAIQYDGAKPMAVRAPAERAVIRTPAPGPGPRINGPRVYGCRPGRPFLYRIPCQGERPIEFAAVGLPKSIRLLNPDGILTGQSPSDPGIYRVRLSATNQHGNSMRELKIVVGETLALTPPMGWNSWYTHFNSVSDQVMREAADAMVASGMADVGYQYVNIDDCWMKRKGDEPYRAADGTILCNERFPDMKAMTDYIHRYGLKAGLYTSPGPWTCGGYVGAYGHEKQDAETFARWGFDFLKYDWCSYGSVATGEGVERAKKPYLLMGGILRQLDRDIQMNLCQYGMDEVWKWGAEAGQSWRTGGDLGFTLGKGGIYQIARKNLGLSAFAGPGAWNDPDYLILGRIGDHEAYVKQRRQGVVPKVPRKDAPLTPSECYTYMSLWCLMSAPLFYSGDMGELDAFTVNILCNPEVIDVDQDELGKQAEVVRMTDSDWVLAKPMADGSLAVGLFNVDEVERDVAVTWSELKMARPKRVRDLWRQKDLSVGEQGFTATIGRHSCEVIRIWPADEH